MAEPRVQNEWMNLIIETVSLYQNLWNIFLDFVKKNYKKFALAEKLIFIIETQAT